MTQEFGFGRRRVGITLLLTMSLMVLGACGERGDKSKTPGPQPSAQLQTPTKTGPITIALPGDTTTLDPSGTELVTWAIVRNQVFETLLTTDAKTLQLKPVVAQEWKWEDSKTLQIKLKPNVTFHDGAKLTAADVKFSIEHFADATSGSPFRGRVASVAKIDVVNDTELKLSLSVPDVGVLGGLCQVFLVKAGTPVDTLKTKTNGTGPYKLVEWQQGNFIRLEPNANHWNKNVPASPVTFKIMSQLETRISSLLSGDLDLVLDVDLKEVQRLQKEAGVQVIMSEPGDAMWVSYINARKPYLKDERVRKALAYALDRATYVKSFQAGLAKVTNSPHAAAGAFYDKKTDGQYPYDLKKAAALLAEAGFPGGKGLKLTVVFPSGYPDFKTGSEMWQASLAELGVQVEVKELELAAWANTVQRQYDFDLAWDIKQDGASDPAVLYATTGSFAPGPTNRNALFVDTYPELTNLLAEGKGTPDATKRVEIYNKVNEFWNEHMIQYTIATKPTAYAAAKSLTGLAPHPAIRYLDLSQLKRM